MNAQQELDHLTNMLALKVKQRLGQNTTPKLVGRDEHDFRATEDSGRQAWDAFSGTAEHLNAPTLDQSPRAIKSRAILRIAGRYAWGGHALAHFLDTKSVPYLSDLTDPQLDDLHERMEGFEDAAINGYDLGGGGVC